MVVEPEAGARGRLAAALLDEGYQVVEARDGLEAFATAESTIDLAVVELALPVISGLEVLAHFTQRRVPVVVASTLANEENRVRTLDLGADDVIAKPCSTREIVARVRAVLRRTSNRSASSTVSYTGMTIDIDRREVWINERLIETTAREFDLLAFLASSPGVVFTRERLLQSVWQSSSAWQQPGTVTEHIRRLREKIEVEPHKPRWLVTVRGVGYKFERRHNRGEVAVGVDRRSALGEPERVEGVVEHSLEVA